MQKEANLGKGTMKGYQKIEETLVFSLKDKTKGKKLLLGVSGGIDSAVVATLCARAKPDETHALIMPTASSNKFMRKIKHKIQGFIHRGHFKCLLRNDRCKFKQFKKREFSS